MTTGDRLCSVVTEIHPETKDEDRRKQPFSIHLAWYHPQRLRGPCLQALVNTSCSQSEGVIHGTGRVVQLRSTLQNLADHATFTTVCQGLFAHVVVEGQRLMIHTKKM
jgi:hypothetical protein